ncbi:aminotransferase class I/II-fold pyridoxal phosphate-dependent enzyme [Cyclobacteriaceae bacterium]|nr:aminotransferase class I/II-fold pyridoxal phosphate-dependent enzyme [Cyclobacteriaceae bacterium]
MKNSTNKETQAIRTQLERTQHKEHSAPLFLTSSYMFDSAEHANALFEEEVDGNIYGRYSNPNVSEFVEKMCLLEGTEAGFATSTGMAAVFASMAAILEAGDHVLVSKSVFGSTIQIADNILGKWGVEADFLDIYKPEDWDSKFKTNTKMLVLETPSNPGLDLIDIEFAAKLCKKHGALLNVDNCFPTPYLQNPAKWGADIITHSATKFIDGQGRVLGGIVLGSKEIIEKVKYFCRHTGPSMSPFNAWTLSKSLETLAIRMDRHCQNALTLAKHLENHPEVAEVRYPFLESHPQYALAKKQMTAGGGIVSFIIKGGLDQGMKFLNSNESLSHGVNLGDTRTIITHPSSTTHSKMTEEDRLAVGITPGLIRISCGLEHIDDIIAAVDYNLEESKK